MWANDLDSRNTHVITRNLSRCLNDWEPKVVTPSPALHRSVIQLTAAATSASEALRLKEEGAAGSDRLTAFRSTAAVGGQAATTSSGAAAPPTSAQADMAAAASPACDQSPAALFYGPTDDECAAQCEPNPGTAHAHGAPGVGATAGEGAPKALVSHIEGEHHMCRRFTAHPPFCAVLECDTVWACSPIAPSARNELSGARTVSAGCRQAPARGVLHAGGPLRPHRRGHARQRQHVHRPRARRDPLWRSALCHLHRRVLQQRQASHARACRVRRVYARAPVVW